MKWIRLAAWLTLAAPLTVGCARAQPFPEARPANPEGWIVLGERSAAVFEMMPGDTLWEVSSAGVPTAVKTAAGQQAQAGEFDRTCSRFFVAGVRYVVLFSAACDVQEVRDDGIGLGAFDSSGARIGQVIYSAREEDYRDLRPVRRSWPTPEQP